MPYDARVIQVLIASPGDVVAERAIVAEVIHEWNSVNARERRVVLVPVRWETDATPEMGDPPQVIINRQIVDQCDLVVGMFWTRLGTPTDAAESGTAEELDRAGDAGKRILLYFSNVPVAPEKLNLDEYRRLEEFKTRTYPNGLVEKYDRLTEFRSKLVPQLARAVAKLIAEDASGASRSLPPGVRLSVEFVAGQPLRVVDDENPLVVSRVVCVDENDIPDYTLADDTQPQSSSQRRADYYRELVRYHSEMSTIAPVRFAVANGGEAAVRDIHMEIDMRVISGTVQVRKDLPTTRSNWDALFRGYLNATALWANTSVTSPISVNPSWRPMELEIGQGDGDDRSIQLDLPVVQAGRTIVAREALVLQAEIDASVEATATVYSSAAPPFTIEIPLRLQVAVREMTYLDMLDELEPAAAAELRQLNGGMES